MKGKVVKVKKRKVFILIISLVVTIIVVLGVSYALLQKNVVSDNGKIIYKVGDLEVKLDESGSKDICLTNAMPTEDSDGLKNEPYSFSLVNNGSQRLKYTIYLEDDTDAKNKCGTNCELISDEFIRYNLANDEKKLKTASLSSSDSKIYTGIISGNSIDKLNLRVWLSLDANNGVMGKYYFGKIRVEATYISNEDLDNLCLTKGGNLVVDDECRKYYVKLNNFIENSDFKDMGRNWIFNDGAILDSVTDGIATVNCTAGKSSCGIFQQPLEKSSVLNHKYFFSNMIKSSSATQIIRNGLESIRYLIPDQKIGDTEWHQLSDIITFDENIKNTVQNTWHAFVIYVLNEFDQVFLLKNPVFIDLTLMFGEGNEPNKEWCDKNLNIYMEYNETGVKTPISEINYKEKTSYYDVIDLFN